MSDSWRAVGIDALAAERPDQVAVVDNAGSCSYSQLLDRVGCAMHALRDDGVGAGKSVLLVASNTRESVVSYLAALRLGARVVCLDKRAGESDVRHALEQTGAQLMPSNPIAGIGDPRDVPAPEPGSIVLFTSGTSSTPKGVVHSMRSLFAGVRNFAHTLSFTACDSAFLVSPLASITGVSQLHLTLECGGRLILEDAFSASASLERLIALQASVFGGAPFVLEELLGEAARQEVDALPLRAVAVGGSAIARQLLEDAAARYGIVPSRVYGSSECPIGFGSAPDDELDARLSDEGVAMPGTEGRIDPDNGELQVRGENLFQGYLDPEHNADALTSDGWFRTGDQATLTGGRLRVTGRLKEVVARKGMKLSLAEIDELMRGMPGCLSAAAYGLPDPVTGERLALAVQVPADGDLGLDEVAGWLSAAGLARWKLPEQVVIWHEPFPYTASGKVLRRALADGGADRPTHYAARLHTAEIAGERA